MMHHKGHKDRARSAQSILANLVYVLCALCSKKTLKKKITQKCIFTLLGD